MAAFELPPEAYILSTEETADVCQFSNYKTIGALLISLLETSPADGIDQAYGADGFRTEIGDSQHVLFHIDYLNGLQQIRHDFVRAATYMQLHPIFSKYGMVLGVTYSQMAKLAVRAFGFRTFIPTKLDPEFHLRLASYYRELPVASKAALQPVGVYMPVKDVIDRFGVKHLGTDPIQLYEKIIADGPLVYNNQIRQAALDPMLQAIQNMITTMGECS